MSYAFLTEQAETYERLIKQSEARLEDLNTKLKHKLEPLLTTSSQKAQSENFVSEAKKIFVPLSFKIRTQKVAKETEWIAIKPSVLDPAPDLKDVSHCKVFCCCKEEARYAYQNEKGDLLFYTVRLVDKTGKKSALLLARTKKRRRTGHLKHINKIEDLSITCSFSRNTQKLESFFSKVKKLQMQRIDY